MSNLLLSSILKFISDIGFGFTVFSAILLPINSPLPSAVLWTTFLEAVFAKSSSVFVAMSNIFFLYLSDRFLANDENQCPLTCFLVLDSIE